jgi:hypothetical protein
MVGYGDSYDYINPDPCGGGASSYLFPLTVKVYGGLWNSGGLWLLPVLSCPVLAMVGYGDSYEYINPQTWGCVVLPSYLVPLAVEVYGGLWNSGLSLLPVLSCPSDGSLWGQPWLHQFRSQGSNYHLSCPDQLWWFTGAAVNALAQGLWLPNCHVRTSSSDGLWGQLWIY